MKKSGDFGCATKFVILMFGIIELMFLVGCIKGYVARSKLDECPWGFQWYGRREVEQYRQTLTLPSRLGFDFMLGNE